MTEREQIDWTWTPQTDDDDETSAFGLNEWLFEPQSDDDQDE